MNFKKLGPSRALLDQSSAQGLMDITPNAFKWYIQASFVPVVVVLCTEGVEKLCQKQGFKFVDAFRTAPLEKRRSMHTTQHQVTPVI